jgi:hypothetical protein
MIEKFLAEKQAFDMYIRGAAGTGKTTSLSAGIKYCIDNEITYTVCAYSHDACGILRSKLPTGAKVTTLHSWLKKRPGVNQHASKPKHIDINVRSGKSERVTVLFIDEFSQIGEKDLMDIRAEQDEDYDGIPGIKVIWIGDPHQLPPVGDMESVRPYGKYQIMLTKVWRQGDTNPLLDTLTALVSYIEGTPAKPLIANSNFIRGVDIVKLYKESTRNKVLLAYTNKRVEELNALIEGKITLDVGDTVFSPTNRKRYTAGEELPYTDYIALPFGEDLHVNSKYKTLEYLMEHKLGKIIELTDEEGDTKPHAVVFGHYTYKVMLENLKRTAASSNASIEREFRGYKAAGWAHNNPTHPLARARSKAWRDFLTFNDCVICIDFPHVRTVHKSQGSTFEDVYVDINNLGICADTNYNLYLRLLYVALSRASDKAFTN